MRESYANAETTGRTNQKAQPHRRTQMNITRYIAVSAASAGILGGVAVGLAGMANAGTYSYQPTPRPGIVATPHTIARPPVVVIPGHRWHTDRSLTIDVPAGE